MNGKWTSLGLFLLGCTLSTSQIPEQPHTEFEVAVVRRVTHPQGYASVSPPQASHFIARNVTLSFLIAMAFEVDGDQIHGGPAWMSTDTYELQANSYPGTGYERLRMPLQKFLSDQFGLKVHREVKEVLGYELVVANGGPKLNKTESLPDDKGYVLRDQIHCNSAPLSALAGLLAIPLGRPVINATGITGNYEIKLRFAPTDGSESQLPSLTTAVKEQLGLKLVSRKVNQTTLVIDHVERIPADEIQAH